MKLLSPFRTFLLLSFAMSGCAKLIPEKPTSTTHSYSIEVVSGDNQTTAAGTATSRSFVALVRDKANGQPANNIQVDWRVVSGGGSFSNKYEYSSSQGNVSTNLVMGTTLGSNTATATIHGQSDAVTFHASSAAGSAAYATSSIVGSGPVLPDGINFSTITVTLKDAYLNPVIGTVPVFSATGSGNVYGGCSATNSSGVSSCTLKSTTAETKILSIVSPIVKVDGTVVFATGPVNAGNSSISGTGSVIANATATSTVTITLRDVSNLGVSGVTPTFAATDTGSGNTYGTCSATNGSGVSTCTLKSTKAEIKTLSITSPVSKTGGTVAFVAGPPSATNTTLTGTGPVEPDGVSTSVISVVVKDANSNPISGTVPTFTATNTAATNVYGVCSSTNASGQSTCSLASTTPETKTLSLTAPVSKTGGTVVFAPTAVVAANSTIVGTTPVVANGASTSTVTITLKDVSQVPVSGVVPTFNATDTGSHNVYGTCSSTNASGVSTCTLASTLAETKTITLTSPVSVTGNSVVFTAGTASAATSTISGTNTIVADGAATSTVTITLQDAAHNPIIGTVPTFTATDTGSHNSYGTCSATNATGISTCLLASTKAETKTLSIATPVISAGGTVDFVAGAASLSNSSLLGSGPVVPDGVSTSTITVTLQDAFHNPISGTVPTFSATDTGSTNVYGTCTSSSTAGISTCALSSTQMETKTLSLTSPVSFTGGTVVFAPGAASALYSTIVGTGSVVANGVATSSVTIVIKDSANIAIPGVTPTFTATNTANGNTYYSCGSTDSTGTAYCSFSSTKAEVKTLSIASPITKVGGTVSFVAGTVSAANSQITGTGPVVANGTATSAITIVLYDAFNNPISGGVPTFSATDSGSNNVYGTCSTSSATGSSTCTLASTHAEVKTLSITSPVSEVGGTVSFTAGSASSSNSSIVGSGPVAADGTSLSTITVTLLDAYSNPVAGTVPTFSATNTGSSNVYGTCSTTNISGVSTCTLKSTGVETKTLSLVSPIAFAGGSVSFIRVADPTRSSIVGSGPVIANGTASSTVTITLKDYNNAAFVGVVPTFSATNTSNSNNYGTCSATNASGISTCTLKSTGAETKTLSITSPINLSGGTVSFTQAISPGNSLIAGTGPTTADGTSVCTVTVILKDFGNNPVVGTIPTFSATDTGSTNNYGTCTSTNTSGVATCSLTSNKGETKTLSLVTPIAFTGSSVVFNAAANSTYTTITGTGSVAANGTSTSTVTITLKDNANTAIAGVVPTFSATNTNSGNAYGTCSSSNVSGVSTCTLKSTKAETKTLSLVSPVAVTGGTVVFTQAASPTNSTIVGTGPVSADGTSTSTITINLKDYSNIAMVGVVPTFTATNTSSLNTYGTCSSSSASGDSTCTLSSGKAETKALSLVTPVAMTGGNVVFNSSPSATYTTITGTGSVAANGITASTVTITLKDNSNSPVVGVVPTFSATDTGSGNTYGACSSTSASGVATCSLKSTQAETKTLSLVSPVTVTGGTVVFTQAAHPTFSSIVGTGPVDADGTSTSTITITLKDYGNAAMVGVVPTFTATNNGSLNVYGTCSSTNGAGVSTCSLSSGKPETKTLSLATPSVFTGGTVVFNAVASSTNTTITGTSSVIANGVATSTVTITLKDYSNTAIAGVVPTFSATNTGSLNTYGACSSSSASGVSTCTLKSTKAETKTLSLSTPVVVTGGTVVFTQAANSTYSSIVGTSSVGADGVSSSTITITLKDYANVAMVGVVPTFTATNTSSLNTYGTCSSSNASGVSTCSLQSGKAEPKVLSLATPAVFTGGTVTFTQVVKPSNSSISGTGPVLANGTSSSTITITLKDYANVAIAGIVPTFTATNTGSANIYGTCSSTSASGVSTCTLKSLHAETKTLNVTAPVSFTGGTVVFN